MTLGSVRADLQRIHPHNTSDTMAEHKFTVKGSWIFFFFSSSPSSSSRNYFMLCGELGHHTSVLMTTMAYGAGCFVADLWSWNVLPELHLWKMRSLGCRKDSGLWGTREEVELPPADVVCWKDFHTWLAWCTWIKAWPEVKTGTGRGRAQHQLAVSQHHHPEGSILARITYHLSVIPLLYRLY